MNPDRPLSWSAISSFEFDKEKWYRKYILGEQEEGNQAMKFGKTIGDEYIYERSFKREHKLEMIIGGIRIIGFVDAFDLDNKRFIELKTGKSWTKKKAETHGQIDLYCAMIYVQHKIKPEDLEIKLIWLETEESGDFDIGFVKGMKPVIFPIKKTMLDVVNILAKVKRVKSEMEEYCKEHA